MNYLVNIRKACFSSYVLESFFNSHVPVHFFLHLLFQESREEPLYQKFMEHFDFILIFIFVSSHISNFLLPPNSLHSSLEGLFLVLDRLLKRANSLGSFFLVHINLVHDRLNFNFSLNSFLFSSPLLLCFFIHNI